MSSFSTLLTQPSLSQVAGIHLRTGCKGVIQAASSTATLVILPPLLPRGLQNRGLQSSTSLCNRHLIRRSPHTHDKRGIIMASQVMAADELMQESKDATVPPNTLAQRWRDIQGATDWKGMLDPIDSDLRAELIRYGEFAQACYDGFDGEVYSKYRGSCRYKREDFLNNAGLANSGYEVTKYLYTTTDVTSLLLLGESDAPMERMSNWAGFVAICTDEERIKQLGRRDIVVAWRGTSAKLEWAANLKRTLVPSSLDDRDQRDNWLDPRVRIEKGFLSLYTTKNPRTRSNKSSAREQLLSELLRLIKKYDDETLSITITGHSLGAAMATVSAYDIAESGINRHSMDDMKIPSQWNEHTTPTPTSDPSQTTHMNTVPITVFSFAGPRVGNSPFVDRVQALGIKALRVVNYHDYVPRVPGFFANEEMRMVQNLIDKLRWTYSHCGVELEINSDHSPYLRRKAGVANVHNLEGYLHLLAGYQGPGRGIGKDFKLMHRRDIALVNKSSDFLVPQQLVPSFWRQLANKGLVQNDDGDWIMPERDAEDMPYST